MTLPFPCLCVVTDRKLCPGGDLVRRVAGAVEGGAAMVQLREKDLPLPELLALARDLRAAIKNRTLFIVNGDVEVALATGADGLHLPEAGIPMAQARRLLGRGGIIGRSVHSAQGALRAEEEGADYLIVGTVFETASHPGGRRGGLALLKEVGERVRIPFLGIGGINATNVGHVMEAGAAGAAVISAVLGAADPKKAARDLVSAMEVGARRAVPLRGGW